jgi:hypothetical protein
MSAANALLRAIQTRLAADAALASLTGVGGIIDRLLARPVLPCLVIGDLESRDYSTSTEKAEEHFLTLEAWAEAGGRRRAQEIAARVVALLDDAALPLEGGIVLVNLQHRSTRSRREAKTRNFVAEMQFRAVTE